MILFNLFVILQTVLIFILAVIIMIDWTTHIEMTKSNSNTYGYSSYKRFEKEFDNVNWEHDSSFKSSLFGMISSDTKIHANIIKFNNIGMIMNNPISYFKTKLRVRKYLSDKGLSGKNKNVWR